MRHVIALWSLAIATLILTACATPRQLKAEVSTPSKTVTALQKDTRMGEQIDRVCNLEVAATLDVTRIAQKTALLSAGRDSDYVVAFQGNCEQLGRTRHVTLQSRSRCLRDNDVVLVARTDFFLPNGNYFPAERCLIDEIYQWDAKAQ
ncbi:DUF6491 family protein [Fretibacter rubidus]|uniref:DUF6491 family protein n=1 Tax=Fretibacter rubidus TaxID=570162 RepID=UPI00352A3F39